MTDLAQKLEQLAVALESERGELDLLALFQREEQDHWEIVFSAPWALDAIRDSLGYVGQKAAEVFGPDAAASITGVVILDRATAVLSARFRTPGEYFDFYLNGIAVTHAIIARLRPSAPPQPRQAAVPISNA